MNGKSDQGIACNPRMEADHGCSEHEKYFAGVASQKEVEELSDVLVNASPLFDGVDNRYKVVIREHHVGSFFCYVRPRDAHDNSDVGCFDCRRIVDSIPSHRNDVAIALP